MDKGEKDLLEAIRKYKNVRIRKVSPCMKVSVRYPKFDASFTFKKGITIDDLNPELQDEIKKYT